MPDGTKNSDSAVLSRSRFVISLSGFAALLSTGTLLCCALPIILVSAGLGVAVVTLTSQFPFLITLSAYKLPMFAASALLLFLSAWLMWRTDAECPVDSKLATACNALQIWSKRLFFLAGIIWVVGFFFAYLLLPLKIWIEG